MKNTILFGNGINRLSKNNISWGKLLDTIKETRTFDDSDLPNTMIYERIILENPSNHDNILSDEFDVKKHIADLMIDVESSEIYTELFTLNVQNYLTTNYDYSFTDSLIDLKEVNLPIHDQSTEDIYSVRRVKRISNIHEKEKYFWQIHGEINKPASIMLGLDHYCGYVGKINSYIKGGYKYIIEGKDIEEISIEEKFNNNQFNNTSWVELFFNSNIHIIGFSLDFSEIDLWWIINKRARLKKSKNLGKKINNKIIFYCTSIDEQKRDLLKSFDVEVQIDKLSVGEDKYRNYYKNLIKRFKQEF